uniref:2-hydroxyacyl-CoA lyase 2 n=1 Tax=Ditylenchus dipsaci TaxID=166011 RepID=A0A915DVR5_9BILA
MALFLIISFIAAVFFLFLFKRLIGIQSLADAKKIFSDLLSNRQAFFSAIFQVDENSTRHGGELVASVLKAHGVEEIFTLCGGHISPILTAGENLGIRIIDTRHEVSAVFAADSVARLRQKFGVAAVTAGPGITNSITALKNSQMAESPLVLLGGAAPTLLKDRGALQDIDQLVLLRPLCKYTARITQLKQIVPALRKAIKIAQSGTPGPVFLEGWLFFKSKGFKKIVETYLFAYISWQFGNAWRPQDITPLPLQVPQPSSKQLNQVANLILSAKKPLLLMGSQATLPPVHINTLADLVKKLGIPTYLGGMCRGLLGADCNIQMRQNRREALKDADLVILAGSVTDFRLSYGKCLSSKSKVVAINRSVDQLYKNHKIFWQGSVFVQADVASTLEGIYQALNKKEWNGAPKDWIQELRSRDEDKESANQRKMTEKTEDGYLNPLKILSQLNQVLPDNAILVADGGDFVGSAAYIVRPRGPFQWLDPGAFGTLGVGGGFALGAKAVNPVCPVVILYGDGASGFSLMEFDSFVRHKLPVVAIIGNDACWSQIARDQVPWFNSSVGCELAYTKYDVVGEGLGANGVTIGRENSSEQFREAFEKALKASQRGESTVINVLIGKTDFRKGSINGPSFQSQAQWLPKSCYAEYITNNTSANDGDARAENGYPGATNYGLDYVNSQVKLLEAKLNYEKLNFGKKFGDMQNHYRGRITELEGRLVASEARFLQVDTFEAEKAKLENDKIGLQNQIKNREYKLEQSEIKRRLDLQLKEEESKKRVTEVNQQLHAEKLARKKADENLAALKINMKGLKQLVESNKQNVDDQQSQVHDLSSKTSN